MKTLFISFLFAMSLQAQDEPAAVLVDKTIEQEAQYSLRLNHIFEDQCRIAVFLNKNENHFIVKTFTPRQIPSFERFIEDQDSYLKKDKRKFSLKDTLEGKTKNHLFWIEGRNLIAKYHIYDKALKDFRPEESLILENLNCANK